MDYSLFLLIFCYSGLLSLLGLALVLRHRVSGIPDFSLVLNVGLGVVMSTAAVLAGLDLYVGPVLAFAAGSLLGAVEYRGAMRVTERRGDDAVRRTLMTIGVLILGHAFLSSATYWAATHLQDGALIFHSLSKYDFWVGDVRGIFLVIPLACVAVYTLFAVLGRRTRFWQLLTASGEDVELAMIQGVDPWRVRLGVWALSGGVACLAGSLFPPFFHVTPGGEETILLSLLAVFVLGGFESALCAVLAGYVVGFSELFGTFFGQFLFGTWFGEYRPLISVAFIYFGLLLMPRGLPTLRDSLRDAYSYIRRNQEGVVKVAAFVLVVVGFSALVLNVQMNTLADEKAGWINVANSVGRAGATIYGDAAEAELPESLYYSNVKWPPNLTTIRDLVIFSATIKNAKATIVYRHENMLYLFVDEERAFVYDPTHDNFGR